MMTLSLAVTPQSSLCSWDSRHGVVPPSLYPPDRFWPCYSVSDPVTSPTLARVWGLLLSRLTALPMTFAPSGARGVLPVSTVS